MPLRLHGTLLSEDEGDLATPHGRFRVHRYRNLRSGHPTLALVAGDPRGQRPLLARVHSSCVTSEALGACDCDCAEQLDTALERLAREGRGVLFYLLQEGRGAGFAAKARDRMWVQASHERLTTFEAYEAMGLGTDRRRYDEVAFLRRLLGVEAPLRLLTSNPEKAAALGAEKVPIASVLPIGRAASPWNHHYLASKRRSGHALELPDRAPPSPLPPAAYVERLEPERASQRFVRVAAYLLPVRTPGERAPLWLRLRLDYDLARARERILLVHEGGGTGPVPVRVQPDLLLDRFPAQGGGRCKPLWWETLRAFRAAGRGIALLQPEEERAAPPDAGLLAHFAARVDADAATPLVGAGENAAPLAEALAAAGLRVAPPRHLDAT